MTGSTGDDHLVYLRIYLNDHLMGAVGGIALARRCLGSNRGTALGDFLERFLLQVMEDRASLEGIMRRFGFRIDRVKLAAAVVGERLGRLKLNGPLRLDETLFRYSDLSRLIELESLVAGVSLKQRLWESLDHVATSDPRLDGVDFDRLLDRAASQLEELNHHRLEAAERALATG